MTAHNINIKKLMSLLLEFETAYVDIMIDDEYTIKIRPSFFSDQKEEGTLDINDLTA